MKIEPSKIRRTTLFFIYNVSYIITECRIISRNWNLSTNFDQIQHSEVPYRKIRFCIKIKLQRIKQFFDDSFIFIHRSRSLLKRQMGISISLDSVARKKAWHPTRDVRAHTSDTTCAHFLMNLDQKEKKTRNV